MNGEKVKVEACTRLETGCGWAQAAWRWPERLSLPWTGESCYGVSPCKPSHTHGLPAPKEPLTGLKDIHYLVC